MLVQVELAALGARLRRDVSFIHGGGDAVDVQGASERQPAEAGANDRD